MDEVVHVAVYRDIDVSKVKSFEMEERAEVYRGVVRAAEAALEKVREKVTEDLRRLDEERCGPVDAEYEKAMEDYERIADEVDREIHVAEIMLDEAPQHANGCIDSLSSLAAYTPRGTHSSLTCASTLTANRLIGMN